MNSYSGTPSQDPGTGTLALESTAEKYIRAAMKLVGIVFSSGVLAVVLKAFGIQLLPKHFSVFEYARLTAFAVSAANVLVWMWFPLEDIRRLQTWLRSKKHGFPANTSEFFAIILVTVLLLALTLSALRGPVWFGVAGTAVYLWNFIGFAHVQGKLRLAVADTKDWLRSGREDRAAAWEEALVCIERYWSCRLPDDKLATPQQARHSIITLAFALDTGLAIAGTLTHTAILSVSAYFLGAAIIVAGEVVIAFWRTTRDSSLTSAGDKLRSLG